MEKTVNIIEPGSFLHGILNSDFDNFLLYRYLELEVNFAKIIEENNKSNPETTAQHIEFFINQLEVKIADNNRILKDLEINLNNQKTEAGFVSVSLIKKNNLISVNDKAECFIKYLRSFNFKAYIKKPVNSKFTVKSVIIAYFYMYKKGIYPIPEIIEEGKKLQFYKKLADKYQFSYNSVRIDWKPLEEKIKRFAQSENIKLAIKLLETFNNPKITEAIELANSELKDAELKS